VGSVHAGPWTSEADDFFAFIADVSGANNGERHPLQVMYGVGGERPSSRRSCTLSGYDNSRPCGSATARSNQMQHDIWALLDSCTCTPVA